jgi:hypothetical protein
MITNPEVVASRVFAAIFAAYLVDLLDTDLLREANQESASACSVGRVRMRRSPGRSPRRMRRRGDTWADEE